MFQENINKIRTAILGKEVKGAIADGIQEIYDDAISAGNTAVEVMEARGEYKSLNDRLQNMEEDIMRPYRQWEEECTLTIKKSTTEEELADGEVLIIYEE